MLGKKINNPVNNVIRVNYKFNINDPVFCTKNNIKNAIVKGRYTVSGNTYYKVGNNLETKICKEQELIHR